MKEIQYSIPMITRSKVEFVQFTKLKVADALGVNINEIDENTEFVALGLDSLDTLFLLQELEDYTETEINPLVFWDYPNIELLSEYFTNHES